MGNRAHVFFISAPFALDTCAWLKSSPGCILSM